MTLRTAIDSTAARSLFSSNGFRIGAATCLSGNHARIPRKSRYICTNQPEKIMNGLDTSGNREIRIFLSSTFSDMQEERNYLTKKIFPSIRETCEKRGVSFTVLDLRWGITEEASRTGKVIEICMDEIRRTKPFFIGLLGGRYGWIPTEKETGLNRHLTEKYPWITEYLKSGCSITEIEMQYAVLAGTDDIDAFFFLREMESVPARFREKDGSLEKEKLGRLRDEVLKQSREGRCTADFYTDMPRLGRVVRERLLAMIDRRFPENVEQDIDRLIFRSQAFERSRLRSGYIDNAGKRLSSMDRAFNENPDVILVTGEKGLGKSALLANWHPQDKIRDKDGKEWCIIRTDVDDSVNSVERLAGMFMYQVRQAGAGLAAQENEPGTALTELPEYLKGSQSHFVWVIDSLGNIVTDNPSDFGFLFTLPGNVRLIIAADKEFFDSISCFAKGKTSVVKVMPLDEIEKLKILKGHLSQYGKSLTEKQEIHIMSSTILSNPSLLELFINELVQFGIYEELDGFIDRLVSADSRKELITRVLDIIEADFGTGTIRNILGLMACADYGLDETLLIEELHLTQLDWSAIYSAVESLVIRHGGLISIKEDYIHKCIADRYLVDGNAVADIRRSAIRILKKERKARMRSLGIVDRLLYRISGLNIGGEAARRHVIISYDLARQYFAIGKSGPAIRIVSHEFSAMLISGIYAFRVIGLLKQAVAAGFRLERCFPFPKLLSCSMVDDGFQEIIAYVSVFRLTDPDLPARLGKKLRRMPLPKKFRNKMLDALASVRQQAPAGNIEDSWEPGKEVDNVIQIASFLNDMICMLSGSRIRHIKERAEAVAASLPDDSLTGIFMKYIISYALIREDRIDEAESLFRSTANMTDPKNALALKFEMAFARKDLEECFKQLRHLRYLTSVSVDSKERRLKRMTELIWDFALAEKWYAYNSADAIKSMRELLAECLSAGDDGIGYIRIMAFSLHVKKCFKAAIDAYGILLESETDAGDMAADSWNSASCLKAERRYAEAAEACMVTARYYAGNNTVEYLDKIYSVTENLVAAKKYPEAVATVKDAFMEVQNAGPGLSPDEEVDCYNRIVVMLNMTYDHFGTPDEPLELGSISMKRILECTAEPDIRIISNFTVLLDRVAALFPGRDRFRDAFSLIKPYVYVLLREKKEKFIGILPTLAIVAGERDIAFRILDTVDTINSRYAEQMVMLGMTSEDAEVRKDTVSRVISTVGLNKAKPDDIRRDFVDLLRKYNCLGLFMAQCRETADTASLFTLWNISAAMGDEESRSWCEAMIKALASESSSADILATYVAQRSKFLLEAGPETIAVLFRDCLGDKFGDITNVSVCIGTILENTAEDNGAQAMLNTDNKSRTDAIFEYVDAAVQMADDRPAFICCLVDAVCNMQFSKSKVVENSVTVLNVLCRLYCKYCINSNCLPLKERLIRMLSMTAELAGQDESDANKTFLGDIYDEYRLLGETAPDNIIKARLKCAVARPAGMDNSFADILTYELTHGYVPDAEVYALATGFYISRDMTAEAEDSLGLFEEIVKDQEEFVTSVRLCRAILDANKGEYSAAADGFASVLTEGFGNTAGYSVFRKYFSDFHEMTVEEDNLRLAAISAIYAGKYSDGIGFASRIKKDVLYNSTGSMLVCLSMIHSGHYDDADKFFREKFGDTIEDFSLRPGHEKMCPFLVWVEAAKMHAAKGNVTEASRLIAKAELCYTSGIPSVCRRELAQAGALLQEVRGEQGVSQES